jgi:PAS domain S-box-containing protein
MSSIKTRLTILTMTISLVSIWSLAFYVTEKQQEDMSILLGNQQFSTVSVLAAQVNHELEFRLKSLEVVAEEIAPLLSGVHLELESHPVFQTLFNGGAFVTRLDGTVIKATPIPVGRIGLNYLERREVATAIRDGKPQIGKPVISRILHTPAFMMAVPIRDTQGNIIGALVGVTDLGKHTFLNMITDNKYANTGDYYFIGKQSRMIIASSDQSRIMEVLPAPGVSATVDHYIQGYEGSAVFISPRGVEVLASAKGIPVANWLLAASLPTQEAFAPVYLMRIRMIMITAFLSLTMGAMIWWMLKRQLAPLLETSRTLATLTQPGESLRLLRVSRQDEIGALIDSLNILLKTLWERKILLGESEARFRNMADQAPALIWILNDRNICTWYNRRWLEFTGKTLERSMDFDWMQSVHPDDRSFCEASFQAALLGRNPFDIEFRLLHADGSSTWIADTATPRLDEQGSVIGYIHYGWDISEIKRVEANLLKMQSELQTTLDAIPDLLFVITLEGVYLSYHSARTDLLAAPPENFIGRNVSDVLPQKAAEVVLSALRVANENDHSIGKQYMLNLPQGDLWFELSVVRMPAEPSVAPHFVVMSRDISLRKAAEILYKNYYHNLQDIREAEKASIAREVHDELGGALTALKMEVNWLAKKLAQCHDSALLLAQVELISSQATNAMNTIRQIVTGLRPTILDNLGLLAALEWNAEKFKNNTGIECRVNCLEDKSQLPPNCLIALYRIAQEALTNVARHSGASKVEIEYDCSDTEVTISICDNGCGMLIEDTLLYTSFGIRGMHERAEQLGGSLTLANLPGLCVTVRLPLHADYGGEK